MRMISTTLSIFLLYRATMLSVKTLRQHLSYLHMKLNDHLYLLEGCWHDPSPEA